MGLWLDPQPAALGSRDVYREPGESLRRASTACILNQELQLPTEKGIFITLLLGS